ncbi:carboxymuconolactone decarboxylase family protein [Rhodococcus pyridinivorans]|uniref:carboxymuconolactone decarboxylase family protein n=1 Tax=Rhodococcus pyridinivorans TaxID=103816 RepID=UPI002078AACD|nr:carboxymuconolactone decarboxylase family protein [Rhodococcus pyridinivorans]USI92994.1 carboxymuconolactone decarboxylase family protein [Rhodococcus pyridinivorans]
MTEPLRGRPAQAGPPRLPLRSADELAGDARGLHDMLVCGPRGSATGTVPLTDGEGRLLGPFAIMTLTPDIGGPLQELGLRFRFSQRLTRRESELATLLVASSSASEFEWFAHEPAARAAGFTDRQLQAVLDGAPVDGLTSAETAVLHVVRALTSDETLDDDDFHFATTELGHERLAELVWLVGYYRSLALALQVFRPPTRPRPERLPCPRTESP